MQWLKTLFLSLTVLSPLPAESIGAVEQVEQVEQAPENLSYADAVTLGLVEGITEYLPISSTGHLILTNALLGLDNDTILMNGSGQAVMIKSGGSESFAKPTLVKISTLIPFALFLLLIYKVKWASIFLKITKSGNASQKHPLLSIIVQIIQAVAIATLVLAYTKVVWIQSSAETSLVPFTLANAADAYVIIIQFGAIAAVVIVYWERILSIIMGMIGKDIDGLKLLRNLIVAFLPAAVLGLILKDFIESKLFGIYPVISALIAGGILMLAVTRWHTAKKLKESPEGESTDTLDLHELSIRKCLIIGLLQCVAMWPGTSRSMMTIVGGYLVGLNPVRAAEFSFLLGLITLTAASAYKTLDVGPMIIQTMPLGPVVVGILVSTIAAVLAVKWLVRFLNKHGLALFAWYRIALGIAVFAFLA